MAVVVFSMALLAAGTTERLTQLCTDGQILKRASGEWACAADATGAGSGHTIKDAGVAKTQRASLDLQDGFTATDNAGTDATEVDVALIASDGSSGATSNASGLIIGSDGNLGLLQACSDLQGIAWSESGSTWGCTTLVHVNTGTATLDFSSITATCADVVNGGAAATIAVTGAADGEPCTVSAVNASYNAGNSIFQCRVSAASTVTVRHCCISGACDPASGVFRADVRKP